MRLTLIRHAKSSWLDTTLPDIVRPLNERGTAALITMGAYLKEQNFKPKIVYTSPATRAVHTTVAICESIGFQKQNIITNTDIYFGDVEEIVKLLQHHDKEKSITIVGHEPLLSDLCEYFYGHSPEKFSTCAIATIFMDIHSWKEKLYHRGKLERFVTPKELQQQ